jgi:hypothetical protein
VNRAAVVTGIGTTPFLRPQGNARPTTWLGGSRPRRPRIPGGHVFPAGPHRSRPTTGKHTTANPPPPRRLAIHHSAGGGATRGRD